MSGLQHFCFCRRQWALIHLEQQWSENLQTAEGRLEHMRCHDDKSVEKRGDMLIFRGMRVMSHSLRLSGTCDVVEFHAYPSGVKLYRYEGYWQPFPIEYKHGHSKGNDADRLQLCAQAIALEEMLVCDIPCGALFYEETHRRETVEFTAGLRLKTKLLSDEMNQLFTRGYTPKVKPGTFLQCVFVERYMSAETLRQIECCGLCEKSS